MRRILLLEARDDGTPLEDVTLTEAVQGSLSLAADACEVVVFRGDHARPLKHRDDALEDVAVAIQRRRPEAQPSEAMRKAVFEAVGVTRWENATEQQKVDVDNRIAAMLEVMERGAMRDTDPLDGIEVDQVWRNCDSGEVMTLRRINAVANRVTLAPSTDPDYQGHMLAMGVETLRESYELVLTPVKGGTDEVLAPDSTAGLVRRTLSQNVDVIDTGQVPGLHIGIPIEDAIVMLTYWDRTQADGATDEEREKAAGVIEDVRDAVKHAEQAGPPPTIGGGAAAIVEGQVWRSIETGTMYQVNGFMDNGEITLVDREIGNLTAVVTEEKLRSEFRFEGTVPA